MEQISYIFLHGFLGRPKDWDLVKDSLCKMASAKISCPDYFNIPPLSPKNDFSRWTKNFAQWVESNMGSGPHVLVGYSLGGRLALHALEEFPHLFKMGICVSTNPGFFSNGTEERNARALFDKQWSEKFIREPWQSLISGWNDQSVFQFSKTEPVREESEFRRDLLIKALTNWSLSQQKDFRSYLKNPKQPIAWITGERDQKYLEISKVLLSDCRQLSFQIIQSSGHRILFDEPELLAKNIFLSAHNLVEKK